MTFKQSELLRRLFFDFLRRWLPEPQNLVTRRSEARINIMKTSLAGILALLSMSSVLLLSGHAEIHQVGTLHH